MYDAIPSTDPDLSVVGGGRVCCAHVTCFSYVYPCLRYLCHSSNNTSPFINVQTALVNDSIITLITGWYSSSELGGQLQLDTIQFLHSVGHVQFISHKVQ